MKCKKSDCFNCPYPDCINDYIPPIKKQSPEQIKRRTVEKSLRRKEWQQKGLCTCCGKKPPREGYKMCHECQTKARKYKEEETRKKDLHKPRVLLDGECLCQKCGKSPPAKPYKLCSRCLESNRRHLDLTPTHNHKKILSDFCKNNELFWGKVNIGASNASQEQATG